MDYLGMVNYKSKIKISFEKNINNHRTGKENCQRKKPVDLHVESHDLKFKTNAINAITHKFF